MSLAILIHRQFVWSRFCHCVSALMVILISTATQAALWMPPVFSNHMVLQSGESVPVWGTANAGDSVVVEFADQRLTSVADASGHWRINLSALPPSNVNRRLKISTKYERLGFDNVLIGEVWYCAGQSNMEWPLSKSDSGKSTLADCDDPSLRLLYLRGAARGGSGRYTAEHLARMTPEKFCEGTWRPCDEGSAREFSAVGYFFARRLRHELKVPVGIICTAIGGTPAEAWIPATALRTNETTAALLKGDWRENPKLEAWCKKRAKFNFSRAVKQGDRIPGDALGPNHSFKPTFMYESAVARVIPFRIRGALWYQGESNAETAERVTQHEPLFRLLIASWRKAWGQGDFPFVFVQLPALGRPNWPEFRHQQRLVAESMVNVGMAITMDVGHPTDVHPTQKRPVGERLARWALAKIYERSKLIASGPMPLRCRMDSDNKQVLIDFRFAGKGLQSSNDAAVRGFEIMDRQGTWRRVAATTSGSTIRVDVAEGDSPQSVRYGWSPFPDPPLNLVNSSNLPASPFRMEIQSD